MGLQTIDGSSLATRGLASASGLSTPESTRDRDLMPPPSNLAESSGVYGGKRRRGDEDEVDGRPLTTTCRPCRTRKIKCDSKKPVCDNCEKNSSTCFYPVKQKSGLQAGYGRDMQRRIDSLEERLSAQTAVIADHAARLELLTSASRNIAHPSDPPHDPSAIIPPPNDGLDFFSLTSSQTPENTNATPSTTLPNPDIVSDLINLYFQYINPWAPILNQQSFSHMPPYDIVVHAICVLTLRLSLDARLEGKREHYRSAAKRYVLDRAFESTTIASTQALALLALDLIGSDQGPASWGILALLTRSAVHLGLMKETDRINMTSPAGTVLPSGPHFPALSGTNIIPPPLTWEEDESRRRLFWLIFVLDRYACVSTGWDFALPESEIKRRLPCTDEIWSQTSWFHAPVFRPIPHLLHPDDPDLVSPLGYLAQALDLMGRAHGLQARTVDVRDHKALQRREDDRMTLVTSAKRWFEMFPTRQANTGAMDLMIRGIYHATVLRLIASYLFPTSSGGQSEQYVSLCVQSYQGIWRLCEVARNIGYRESSTPLFVWSCWIAARVSFVHAFLSKRKQPDQAFDDIVVSLKEQAQYWSLANPYVKLLERAKRKWPNSLSVESSAVPDAVHVLLDLSQTAHSAVGSGAGEATPRLFNPQEFDLSRFDQWAFQPAFGDLNDWLDLPIDFMSNEPS